MLSLLDDIPLKLPLTKNLNGISKFQQTSPIGASFPVAGESLGYRLHSFHHLFLLSRKNAKFRLSLQV
jgi:hypothetical protein